MATLGKSGSLPWDAVPVAIKGYGLILIHRSRGADDAGIEPMLGKPYGGDLFLGEPCADDKRAEERLDSSHPLGFAPLAKVHVQLITRSFTLGTGVAKRRCTALTVLSASGFSLPRAGMQKRGSKAK